MTIENPVATAVAHPLEPMTTAEIARFGDVVAAAGLVNENVRFGYVLLREPSKSDVLAWQPGDPITRIISAVVLDVKTLVQHFVAVDVTAGAIIEQREMEPATEGWAPFLDEELFATQEIIMSDEAVIAALEARGLPLDRIRWMALSAGHFGYEDEVGIRAARATAYIAPEPEKDMGTLAEFFGTPVEGIAVHLDLTNFKVLRVVETGHFPLPENTRSNFFDPEIRGTERTGTGLKPIEITQPEGASFILDGHAIEWDKWKLRIGFTAREGVTLHQLSYDGRPIIYRASVSEMVVNYGELSPIRSWQNYFDNGEYQFGRNAASLDLGCDCVGEITYLPAVFADDFGQPTVRPNAICIHEEDFGIGWKHTDPMTQIKQVRRQRRLVISTFLSVGNYDYGFYWYLYLDGKIELEVKATGIVYTSGVRDGDYPFAPQVAPGLGAPVHQHLFNVRLDMTVDGINNAVDEIDVVAVPKDRDNPWGAAFRAKETRLHNERIAQRYTNPDAGRVWRISSTETENYLGKAPSYVLHPKGGPLLITPEDAPITKRAVFATKALWVTKYDPTELWPAGYTPNQHPGGAGLPTYVADNENIDGEDIVLWHTFGFTHIPRVEDWPVMPVDYSGFTLTPNGFFERNPVLDTPDPHADAACAVPAETGHDGHHHH
ncbi:primary-amine oxidase [Microbacterium sp. NPDC077663]|uniref:primary-amine oxidase n=1 Tax=Microbacterium sp. NPDC077663 TaxID=3364189 RepID=UPI0037CBA30D